MSAKEDLLEHARKIETRELYWVPERPESTKWCSITSVCTRDYVPHSAPDGGHGSSTYDVGGMAGSKILDDEAAKIGRSNAWLYNDCFCTSAEEAAEFIRAAVAHADGEAG